MFDGNPTITPAAGRSYRAKTKLSTEGKVEVVAKWDDGVPLAAVRYDTPGLITSIGFEIGKTGS